MKCKTDLLSEKIKRGETCFGTHTCWGGALLTEMYGMAGYDMVWIDTEHGAIDYATLLNTLVGVNTSDKMCSFVRIAWNDMVRAKPILDMGVDGIIFPMIITPEDAKNAVAAVRYPPAGVRGFGPGRAVSYGADSVKDYIATEHKKVWAILQIEDIRCVRNLDEIIKVPGIDAFIVGPCDLSASMGLLGQVSHPDVKKVMDEVAAKVKAAGIPFGVSMGYHEQAVRDWIGRGASMIFADNEAGYVFNGCTTTLANMNRIREESKK